MSDQEVSFISLDDALEVLDRDEIERGRNFMAYIEKGKIMFGCDLVAIPTITQDGRITATISARPKRYRRNNAKE